MSWKMAGTIVGVLTLANIAGLLWSQSAKLWVWALYLLGAFAVGKILHRRSQRRIEAVVAAPEEERATRIAALAEEEQALARLAAGIVGSERIGRVPIDGRVFEYERTPPRLIALIYWPCLLLSILLLVSLLGGPSDGQGAILGVGLMMASCALGIRYAQTAEDQQVIVTPFGLVHRRPNGKRVGILWSEVAWIRNRRFLMALEIHAADGRRRIRVYYTLQGYVEFFELLVSAMTWVEERAA